MVIDDRGFAIKALSHIGYYRLKPYWTPFRNTASNGVSCFPEEITFRRVIELYNFDRELRLQLLDAINRVEISIRSCWMNEMVKAYGAHAHLEDKHFRSRKNSEGKLVWDHDKALRELREEVKKSKDPFIRTFDRYDEGLPPLWATCEIFTIGVFSRWYTQTQDRSVRNNVAHIYGINEKVMSSFLHHLTIVRNQCAHHSYVWNREFVVSFSPPKRDTYGGRLSQSMAHENTKKIYNTLVMLGFMLEIINPESTWKSRILERIGRRRIDVSKMGFPPDYKTFPIWKT